MEAAARVQAGFISDAMDAAVVEWDGPGEMLVHSPALYLDEVVLRDRKRDALRFLDVVESFFRALKDHDIAQMPRLEVTVLDLEEPGQYRYPFIVTTQLLPTFQAKSSFEPKRKAPRMLYPTFWVYWNKLINIVLPETAADVRDNILTQCEWYRAHGLSYRNLGKAVTHAAMSGASDRLAEEIGSLQGLNAEQFRALPEYERDRLIAEHTRLGLRAALGEEAGDD